MFKGPFWVTNMRLHAGNLRKRFGSLVPRRKVVLAADGPRRIACPEMLSHCSLPTSLMPEETGKEEGRQESAKFDQPFPLSFPQRRVSLSQMF